MDDEEYFALSQKLEDVSLIIELLESSKEPPTVLQNLKNAVEYLLQSDINDAEMLLKTVIPIMCRFLQQIYAENNVTIQSLQPSQTEALNIIRNQLKVASNLLDLLWNVLTYLMKDEVISFNNIPSVPVKFAQILFITFEYCKSSQKLNSSVIKTIAEMMDLFRKTQQLHSLYLKFLQSHLDFDFEKNHHNIAYREILEIILQISKILSVVNMKSLTDNWKGFISLLEKSSKRNSECFNLSPAIENLTEEIVSNFQIVADLKSTDVKKSVQTLKVTGFLIRVVLKLFETEFCRSECYDAVFSFWIMILGWHFEFFRTKFDSKVVLDAIESLFDLVTQSLDNQLNQNNQLVTKFHKCLQTKQTFAVLLLANALLKSQPKPNEFELISFLKHIFQTTKACFVDFFYDSDSKFYEDFVVNLSVAVLMSSENYIDVEKVLLEFVVEDDIWTAMLVSDVWILVLKHSSDTTCQKTFRVLVTKLQELQLGVFYQTPAVLKLKMLTRRIFRVLPNHMKNTELPAYNPNGHLSVWRIIGARSIPLSHRYYVELIMTDLLENKELIEKDDFTSFIENFVIISHANFTELQINGSKLATIVRQLWASGLKNLRPNKDFHENFIYVLAKLTIALIKELSCNDLLIILNVLRELLNERHFNLVICDMLSVSSNRNFEGFSKKQALEALVVNLFIVLLKDKNLVVVQSALQALSGFLENDSHHSLTVKIINSSVIDKRRIVDFVQKSAAKSRYEVKYLEKISGNRFSHVCDCVNEPAKKKFKSEVEVDSIIDRLITETGKLQRNYSYSPRQMEKIKDVAKRLEAVVN